MSKYDFELILNKENSLSKIITMITPGSKILEFGPAGGRLTRYLKEELGCIVDIVEIDEAEGHEAAHFANKAFIGKEIGDIESYIWYEQLSYERYEYIIFADVLEHLYYPDIALNKCSELLKDDGSILISIPNIAHDSILINLFYNKFQYTKTGILDDSHIRFFAFEELDSFFGSINLSIVNLQTVELIPEQTEQAEFFDKDYGEIDELLQKREYGNVYQFILNLKKKEYVERNKLNTYYGTKENIENRYSGQQKLNTYNGRKRHFACLYINSGNGYNEQNKLIAIIDANKGSIRIRFDISENVKSLRFDPIEGFPCQVTVKSIHSDGIIEKTVPLNANKFYDGDDNINEFLTIDPNYEIVGEFEGITYIEIEYEIILLPSSDAILKLAAELRTVTSEQELLEDELGNIREQLHDNQELLNQKEDVLHLNQELLNQKEEMLNNAYETLNVYREYLKHTADQLDQANNNLNCMESQLTLIKDQFITIENSACWRITKPVRETLDLIKMQINKFVRVKKVVRYAKAMGVRATFFKCISKIKNKNYVKTVKVPHLNLTSNNNEGDETIVNKTVSIVIPTKNGGREFELLLQNLTNQKGFEKIEIIVVDSGSTDDTVILARRYGCIVIEIKPEEFSHSYARNLGADKTQGDYILFTTQDALPTSDKWLRNIYRALTSNSKIAAVSCSEYPRSDSDLYYRVFAWNHYSYLGAIDTDVIMKLPETDNQDSIRKNAQLSDIACFISRDLFMKYKYRGDFAEDLDLGMRLIKDGYFLSMLSSEMIIHSHDRDSYYYLKRRFVEFLTLKKIFKDQPFLNYDFNKTVKEGIFLLYYLNQEIISWMKARNTTSLQDFENDFFKIYRSISMREYPQNTQEIPIKNQYLDEKTEKFMDRILGIYLEPEIEKLKGDGLMLDAMEGYLYVTFNYLKTCHETVDASLINDLLHCIFKIYTSVFSTFLAYSYFFSEEDQIKRAAFYNEIGEGV